MTAEQKTHWKKLTNPDYMGAYSMPADGSDVTLTIDRVTKEIVKGEKGREEPCTVCHWKETTFPWSGEKAKPMILNRTNSKIITGIYKTPYIEDWGGKKVTLYVEHDVVLKGEKVDGLRIRPKAPDAEKPELKLGTPQFDKAKEFIAKGGSITKVREKYTVPDQVADLLSVK